MADSPDIDLHKPVSRQQLADLSDYYGWTPCWAGESPWEVGYVAPLPIVPRAEEKKPTEGQAEQKEESKDDPHLRSVSEVTGYHIEAVDGGIGHVADFFAEEDNWRIEYMLVDTRNLLPGRHVIISLRWISDVNWPEGKVHINATRDQVKNSPRFDPLPDTSIKRDYEIGLHDHYQFPYPAHWGASVSSERESRL